MPDQRQHRGPHPQDSELFAAARYDDLRRAARDLAWLLDRGYSNTSSLKLVGDRYALQARQRLAVARCVCSNRAARRRKRHQLQPHQVQNQTVWLDGYNVLTTIEAALARGVLLAGRDGTLRDMASMHGSYRRVTETVPAIRLIGQTLVQLNVGPCRWLLDRPVSNSGRLKQIIAGTAAEANWPWEVELVTETDRLLCETSHVVATADSHILDQCARWLNLARIVVKQHVPNAWIIDLKG